MENKIDISIVIVNYNVKDFLNQCLKSVLASETNLNYEIIVVDNASSDNSIQELKPYFPEVNFIELEENLGFGKANNIGFKNSNGKYILILNPDTIIEKDTLQKMYSFMEENNHIGAAGCKVLNHDNTFQPACRRGFPTPWASFSKLFGLQRLFPKSKLFGKYNLTYLDEDEFAYIDSLMGAFIFARKDVIDKIEGFDESYFMYGEDLDLCYRIKEAGYEIAYYPETSIIHFKGESTKRSSINEIKHFYDAMEIFAGKHYNNSKLFLSFIRFGIKIRTLFSYLKKYRKDIIFIIVDLLIINAALLISTKLRRAEFLAFPDYAYPTVFIFLSIITFLSLLFSGEYFESKQSIRKSFFGYLTSFFILTFLTYFFRDFAFSRGILLMTITFGIIFSTIARLINNLFEKQKGRDKLKRILIVGWNKNNESFLHDIRNKYDNSVIMGYVNDKRVEGVDLDYFGETDYIYKIINDKDINEIVVTEEDKFKTDKNLNVIRSKNNRLVHIHIAKNFDQLAASKIISEVSGIDPEVKVYKLNLLRYRLFKRIFDISLSLLMLSILLPVTLFYKNTSLYVKLLSGKKSFIGLYPVNENLPLNGKLGIIGLAHISSPEKLNKATVEKLNEHYLKNYSITLDFDILFKYLFRNKNG